MSYEALKYIDTLVIIDFVFFFFRYVKNAFCNLSNLFKIYDFSGQNNLNKLIAKNLEVKFEGGTIFLNTGSVDKEISAY